MSSLVKPKGLFTGAFQALFRSHGFGRARFFRFFRNLSLARFSAACREFSVACRELSEKPEKLKASCFSLFRLSAFSGFSGFSGVSCFFHIFLFRTSCRKWHPNSRQAAENLACDNFLKNLKNRALPEPWDLKST